MKARSVERGTWLLLGLVVVVALPMGCSPKTTPGNNGPVASKPPSESDLPIVPLTDEEAKSQKVRSEAARMEPVQQTLSLHGWVMAAPGHEATITAPMAGYVRMPTKVDDLPVGGRAVAAKQELFRLEPVLSPLEQAQFQSTFVQLQTLRRSIVGELNKAEASVTAATAEKTRVEELVKNKLRGDQDLEQAHARLKFAIEDLAAAKEKLSLFDTSVGSVEKNLSRPVPLIAPRPGTVLTVHVTPDQYVIAGSPIVSISDLKTPWLRVSIPESDLPRIQVMQPAVIQYGSKLRLQARPINLVPQVDPMRHTADLLYQIDRPEKPLTLARDQMLSVQVPLDSSKEECVVPSEAVVFDSYNGTWVYVELTAPEGKHRYTRRRVELGPVVSTGQVIRPSLGKNDRVVVTGTAALWSREFHTASMIKKAE